MSPNRLAGETSPYLRQHASNPVDWYPWGREAFERARREGKPVLLSIGYAACHWCHVMAHESFENEQIAGLMNELFVNIKVDREERPDLDGIYMQAVQAITGQGGWPMTMFLTPDGEPFYGGTYFPPDDRRGMPGFPRLLRSVAEGYRDKKDAIARTTGTMRELYASQAAIPAPSGTLSPETLERAYRAIAQRYDARFGGFDGGGGGGPKFPQAMTMDFLLRHWRRAGTPMALEMVHNTVRKMARGGVYDQVGGGFHRYSVDERWLVPHFEKMLYDNALMARLGVDLWRATKDDEVKRVVSETIDWVAREMTSPAGGFHSTLDADSEGHEGKFYVWAAADLEALLGVDAALVSRYFGVSEGGNFEGANILHVPAEPAAVAARAGTGAAEVAAAVARAREALYAARAKRVWPARDDKILAAWNGLMLRAVCEGARAFGRGDWRALAVRNGEFLAREMVRGGRVMRSHLDGVTRIPGFLEDHAAVALGFLSLYELTFDRAWFERAREIGAQMAEWFHGAGEGDDEELFDTARDAEPLITRPRDITDNATPSGTSLAAELRLRLAELSGDEGARRAAERTLDALAEAMARHGPAFGHLLGAADLAVHGAVEVALAGDPASADFRALAGAVAAGYAPSLVLAGGHPEAVAAGGIALLEGKPMVAGKATAYVCRRYACQAPVTDAAALAHQLERAGRTG
jgi:uncharacterized protein YyaL (SSP411 family)